MLNNHMAAIPLYMYIGYPIPRPERLYDYILARQGIIKRIETRYISVDALLAPIEEELIGLRLREYDLQPLRLKTPRIPDRLLEEALADARSDLGLEFMYHFRWTAEDGWWVTRPEQGQSRVRVGYVDRDQANIILELHSHNTMPAFYSSTDDGDEQGGRLYGVMGCIDQARPQLALRQGMYGHWLYHIPATAIFDDISPFTEVYPAEETVEPSGGWLSDMFSWRKKW